MRGGRTMLAFVLCLSVVAGCSQMLPTNPEAAAPGGALAACAGVGLDGFLRGDPADPQTAWVEGPGGRTDVLFPAGYAARFAPQLQVLDPAGAVVMEEGDYVYGACVGAGDTLTVDPGASLRLDCGPMPNDRCRERAPQVASNQPGRSNSEVAAVRFTSADGAYVVRFADGTTVVGKLDPSQ